MPLKIFLNAGEKVFINGAVIESVERNARLVIHNQADILRQKDILAEDDVKSPAQRIYFAIQCLYIAPEESDEYLMLLHRLVTDFESAAPSSRELIARMSRHLMDGEIYRALKAAKQIVKYEEEALAAYAQAQLEGHAPEPNLPPQSVDPAPSAEPEVIEPPPPVKKKTTKRQSASSGAASSGATSAGRRQSTSK